jgi:carboxyl-terminal processing protease
MAERFVCHSYDMRLQYFQRILLAWGLSSALGAAPPSEEVAQQLKRVLEVLQVAEDHFADPVALEKLVYQGAIPAMMRNLDPHSAFLDPGQFDQLRQMERSLSKGFGTVVSVLPGRVILLQVVPGAPASKAGLESGDEIIAVNNYAIAQLDMEQIVGLLSEARQSEARLYVKKPNDRQLAQITLKPETMESPSVDRAFLLEEGVGYVRATSFDGKTGQLMFEKIEALGGHALKGLVLDLRGNTGGVVDSSIQLASMFLPPEKLIVTVKGRNMRDSPAKVPNGSKPYAFPMAVLIDRKTASASEIVTGALQDHDRAVVIGEPSYGKGLVQSVFPLKQGAGLALTTAFYYTPSGRSIQKPLKGELDEATKPQETVFKSDTGKLLQGGGGIIPDFRSPGENPSRLRVVMEASGSFSTFAAEQAKKLSVTDDYRLASETMDEFRSWLAERNILPSASEWSNDREWIRVRLHQEIVTIALGVAKGDVLEVKRDPAVRFALQKITAR